MSSSAVHAATVDGVHEEDSFSLQQWMQWYERPVGELARDGILRRVESQLDESGVGLTGSPADDVHIVRRLRLEALLRAGHVHEAVRVVALWSSEERQSVLHYRWHGDEKPFRWKFLDSEDLMLGLATAYALDGQPAAARALLASSHLEGHAGPLARGLSHWLQEPEDDPFDLLVSLSDEALSEEPRGMVMRLLIALSHREGYVSFARHGAHYWQSLLDTERRRLNAKTGYYGVVAKFPVTRDAALVQLEGLQLELDRLQQALPPSSHPDEASLRRQFSHLAEAELELFVLDRSATRALVIYNRAETRGSLQLVLEGDEWVETGAIVTFSCNFPTEIDTTD